MSMSIESHRLAPLLRALCVVVGMISGALALLFFWVVATRDSDVSWAARLGGLGLGAGFTLATWVFAVSAIRGRSPDGVPVRAPWRTVGAELRSAMPLVAAFVAFKVAQARMGGWIAFAIAVGLGLLVGQWRHVRHTADEHRDGPSS